MVRGTLFLVLSIVTSNFASASVLAPHAVIDILNQTIYQTNPDDYQYTKHVAVDEDGDTLVKRLNVQDCIETSAAVVSAFADSASAAAAWYSALNSCAGSIYDQSQDHNCGIVHATVASQKMKYVYSASGSNCDTTAQQVTIQGALDKAYRAYIKNNYNRVYCMELTHGGTWAGYLLVGPNKEWPDSLSCGDDNSGQCVSGGKADAHS